MQEALPNAHGKNRRLWYERPPNPTRPKSTMTRCSHARPSTTAAVAGALLALASLASCTSGTQDEPSAPSTTNPESSTTLQLQSQPARTGEIALTIGATTYEARIEICTLDAATETVAVLAIGEHDGAPIRIEYGTNTGERMVLAIDPEDLLDLGTSTWIGDPDFQVSDATARDDDFELSETQSGTTEIGSAAITCEPEQPLQDR